ncbi:MAG: hypothetical protein GX203_02070 [Acholeplasmataceae bacterium]|nr:hypothetical protein [Acholeplasmataceae bacterium]HOA63436.1 hypothetical protein [Bacilli bacterium]HPT89225.1 hypothetical protein [Bacilli bacterium]HQA19278.1 hypothetical protein [Bacilli bacterium]HQD92649.1 hypothetical protein [Bacilli bacterium]
MNEFLGFPNQPNVQVCPPIVNRQVVVCHRYNIIEQPHICEIHTKIINHTIKRNRFIPKFTCSEENTFCEENIGCCPGVGGFGPMGQVGESPFEFPGAPVTPQ